MKVAIVHYWLVGMRGGEKVVESLCGMFPDADVFTHVYAPDAVSETIRSHRISTTFINSLPFAAKLYKNYLPLMPSALEELDLRGYDLVISSESGPAKGVITPPDSLHLCYCHTPMRYLWNMYHDYRASAGPLKRRFMPSLAHYLRNWDVVSATRVDDFIANSETVRDRIQKYYRRDAEVIHPPVDVDAFSCDPASVEDFYLMVGELVDYKRPQLAIDAFNRNGRRLIVIGGGEMLAALRRRARPNVTLLGPQPFDVLRSHYTRCRGLIFPGEEDFGIVPVEAMASGRPVIAYARGGATETVVDGVTGVLFRSADVDCLERAVEQAETLNLDPARIQAHARNFSADRFRRNFLQMLDRKLAQRGARQAAGLRTRGHMVEEPRAPASDDGAGNAPIPVAAGLGGRQAGRGMSR